MTEKKRDGDPGALRRAHEQSEKSFGAAPDEPSPDDPIERLGRRIGRILSIILAFVLVIYLWQTYFVR